MGEKDLCRGSNLRDDALLSGLAPGVLDRREDQAIPGERGWCLVCPGCCEDVLCDQQRSAGVDEGPEIRGGGVMAESKTPRCDANAWQFRTCWDEMVGSSYEFRRVPDGKYVDGDVARQLETELAAARADAARWRFAV